MTFLQMPYDFVGGVADTAAGPAPIVTVAQLTPHFGVVPSVVFNPDNPEDMQFDGSTTLLIHIPTRSILAKIQPVHILDDVVLPAPLSPEAVYRFATWLEQCADWSLFDAATSPGEFLGEIDNAAVRLFLSDPNGFTANLAKALSEVLLGDEDKS